MKRNLFVALIIASILTGACVMYKATLRTETAGAIDTASTYSLIKYGRNYGDVYSTVAFVIPENGQYRFDIFKPDFEYRIVKGLSGKQAIDAAQEFVRLSPDLERLQVNGIIGPDGNAIGYEVRPLYRIVFLGKDDILQIGYFLKEGNVVEVRIDVDDVVKQREKGDEGGN